MRQPEFAAYHFALPKGRDNAMEIEDNFNDMISKARRGQRLTIEKLADKAGISADRLFQIEARAAPPSDAEIEELSLALSLKYSALVEIDRGWTPEPVDLAAIEGVIVERVAVPYGSCHSNAYILGCPMFRTAAIVDPGGGVDAVIELLEKHQLDPVMILITHGDADHTAGLMELRRRTGVSRVIAHVKEHVGRSKEAKDDGDDFMVGEVGVQLIHTPGHTSGSACYHAGPVCFTGDTLFAGSLGGATRYSTGYRDILKSAAKLMELPDETILLPGHGPPTTVKQEKTHNPFITGKFP